MRRRHLALLPLLALLASGLRCPSPAPLLLATALEPRGAAWSRFETVGFVWPFPENPFDPAQVDLWGELRDPGGTVHRMPGFATREYGRELVGGFEKLHEKGPVFFAVRFTPTEPGTWEWRWVAETAGEMLETEWRSFSVDPAPPGEHGFLRVSDRDPRYLRFDDGSPYFAIGENLCWYDGRGTFAYDDWLAKLAAEGANWIRIWMPSWAFGIEWEELGDYRGRLGRAWQLDQVLEAAERHGIYVALVIQNHGPFSLEANSQWADNPYNAANGGPLEEPTEFFTDPEARALFERRLRYVVARWGYSTHLLAWELWNEVDLVTYHAAQDNLDWHADMARKLDELDPHDHLVTTSNAFNYTSPVWALPEIDLTQVHSYLYPFEEDITDWIGGFVDQQAAFGKPRLVGEFGVDYRGPAETLAQDAEAVGLHDGLWMGIVKGTLGTGMTWWWDNYIDPYDHYSHLGAVAAFVDGIAFDAEGFEAVEGEATAPDRLLAARALRGEDLVLVWIKNARHQWFERRRFGLDPSTVEDALLRLDGVADGEWTARWFDTYSGEEILTSAASVAGGSLELAVPPFAMDVALRLERAAEGSASPGPSGAGR